MRTDNRTPARRLVTAFLLLAASIGTIAFFSGSWAFLANGSAYNLLFVSAALLLILGGYVTEPFFTKPLDALVNLVAFVVALLGVRRPEQFFGYIPVLIVAAALLLLSVFVVVSPPTFLPRLKNVLYAIVTRLGRSVVVFGVLYLLVLASFFTERAAEFWGLLTVLVLLVARRPAEWFTDLLFGFRVPRGSLRIIGVVDARLNPRLVRVQRSGGSSVSVGEFVLIRASVGGFVVGIVLYEIHRASGLDFAVALLGKNQDLATFDLRHESSAP